MSTGDVNNPKRVRLQANERLDTADTDPLSVAAREHLDAYARAVEAQPRNVGSSTPTGLIFQGFGLTLNPTGPTDGKVRVGSSVGVAFDANGRMLIKEAGTTVDITLASGNSQVYAYYLETSSDTAVRRSISVSSPYTESGQAQSTKISGGVGFWVRAGDQTSIVASDVVNGATTALCFLGVANNSGGTVTMTGYNSTTAPNGAFATNRITSVASPSSVPTVPTNGGSIVTMHGLTNAALYMIGQALWKGSVVFTPAAGNNFGAFTTPATGVVENLRTSTVTLSSVLGSVANAATRPDFGGDDGVVPSPLWAYCVSPGSAFLRQGSANNKIQIAPGELLQSDGTHQELLRYRFQGTEEFTLTNGDATNPRCDLLQIKITFDSLLGPQVQLGVKAGTPAASPVIPDPDSGFVPVGVAVVGHGWTTGGIAPTFGVDIVDTNKVVIHDHRVPLKISKLVVDPVLYKLQTAWALSNINTMVTSSNATNALWIRCPTNWGRVICVDVYAGGIAIPTSAITLTSIVPAGLSTGFPSNHGFGTNVASDTSLLLRSRRVDFETLHTPAAGPTIQASAVNKIGVPLWAGGFRVPGIPNTLPQFAFVKVTNANNGVSLGETVWYVAG
jgi:hypothetical protein